MPAAQDPFISFCFNLFCSGMQFDLQIKKSDIISKGEMHQSSRCMQLAADRYAADSSYSAAGVCRRLQACVILAAKPGWRSQVADVHWRAPAESLVSAGR